MLEDELVSCLGFTFLGFFISGLRSMTSLSMYLYVCDIIVLINLIYIHDSIESPLFVEEVVHH